MVLQEEIRMDQADTDVFCITPMQRENYMKNGYQKDMCGPQTTEVELYSDSKYLVDAFNQHWIDGWLKKGWKRGKNEPVKNTDLWKRLLKAKEPHKVTFIWVKGHDGHEMNELCDFLATTAADGTDLSVDEGI